MAIKKLNRIKYKKEKELVQNFGWKYRVTYLSGVLSMLMSSHLPVHTCSSIKISQSFSGLQNLQSELNNQYRQKNTKRTIWSPCNNKLFWQIRPHLVLELFFSPFYRTKSNAMKCSSGWLLSCNLYVYLVYLATKKKSSCNFCCLIYFPKKDVQHPPGCIASSPTITENQEVHPLMHPIT